MLDDDTNDNSTSSDPDQAEESPESSTTRRVASREAGPPVGLTDIFAAPTPAPQAVDLPAEPVDDTPAERSAEPPPKRAVSVAAMFQAPPEEPAPPKPKPVREPVEDEDESDDASDDDADEDGQPKRRRRSRGGRRRRKGSDADGSEQSDDTSGEDSAGDADSDSDDSEGTNGDSSDDSGGSTRRRRRRTRSSQSAEATPDDPENTVVKVREDRKSADEVTAVTGSTRLEAKKQRRKEGREAGRRRAPIVSEAEFLARRESVNREMVMRQLEDYTQIAVLEDKVLVEHYVARESQVSIIGNVYLGKVQNVLPSMEAAFVDIGTGRNAVIYAGEVDWSNVSGGKQRKIEDALEPGQIILVQATKDPIGQKGARLTSQISLAGRFLVYVPGGGSNGISRKLPDSERARLKGLLKEVLPDGASVIVRTAAEGATEEQLTRDVQALAARWEDIERKVEGGKGPQLLYSEPDLMIKVVRDLFNEDFTKLVVQGGEAWEMLEGYIGHVAPDLADRLERWESDSDVFAEYRIEEQIHKALDRKVHLPSGGSLVIDRTEAMTVVDVNTGKFTGAGGNLEETVTKNNLEAAEEIVRQLRLRDIGGIIVVDFIDMVLESNRDLVLRRLVECLGRDRTRHQVAEVTSLGLVQMTRKRIGTGLLESFSQECEHCKGRGVIISSEPIEPKKDDSKRRRSGRGRGRGNGSSSGSNGSGSDNGRDSSDDVKDDRSGDRGKHAADTGADSERGEKSPSESKSGRGRRRAASKAEPEIEQPATNEPASPAQDETTAEPAPADSDGGAAPAVPADQPAAETAERPKSLRRSRKAAPSAAERSASTEQPLSVPAEQPASAPADQSAAPAEQGSASSEQPAAPVAQQPEPPEQPQRPPEPVVTTVVKRTTRKRATRPAAAPDPIETPSTAQKTGDGDQSGPALTPDGSDQ